MPTSQDHLRRRRLSLRGLLPAVVALSSVLLLATCDIDKITAAKKGASSGGPTLTFNIGGGNTVTLGGNTTLSTTPLYPSTITRWSSNAPTVVKVDSATGILTGLTIGTATITARLLGMELDTGFVKTQDVRVRYKGIRITSPGAFPTDSISGLGLTRTVSVFGTNAQNAIQTTSLTSSATLAIHDSGATTQTVASLSSGIVKGLKNGTVYLKAIYDTTLIDSIKIKVRQVAKTITFPDTVFTATAMNFNRLIPITVKDVADSVIQSPVARWRSTDTTIVAIDSITGALRVKVRDTARVFVRVDTVQRSIKVRLIQNVGTLTKAAGDAQTDTIGRLLAVAPQVVAKDSGGAVVPNATVTFRVGVGNGAIIVDSVKTTDANGAATLGSWTLGTSAGTQTVIATTGNISTTFSATAKNGPPAKLGFTVQPTTTPVATAIAPAIKVAVQDSAGNQVLGATNGVSLAFNTTPGGGATLGGTLTQAAVDGIATFSDITVSASAAGLLLRASSGTLTNAVSNSFDAYAAASKLAFSTQPVTTTAGAVMPTVRVQVQDASGALVANATDNVTVALGGGAATLGGTLTVAAVNGVATFSNLTVNAAGTFTLVATATSRTQATSNSFTVNTVGSASKFEFSAQPSNAVAGATINPAVKVRVLDANGALVTSSTQQITLSLSNGTTLSGTVAVNAVSGEATFSNINVTKSGTGYRLVASASGTSITSATSNTFDITPGTASKLGFIQNPTHVVQSATMSPAVTVAVQDANGNTVTTAPATAITLSSGCTGLSGGGPVSTVSGVATFSAIAFSAQATGCALTAAATGFTSGGSTSFNVVAATGPVKLSFTTEPSASTTAGVAMTAGTVNIQDSNGNNVTASSSVAVSISVLSGPGGIFSGTTQYSTTSSATFTSIVFRTAGTYRLLVSATGYRPDTSAAFTVNASSASQLGFVTQPSNIVAGVPFPSTLQVSVQDQYGNSVAGATNSIQLSVQLAQTPFTSMRFNNGLFTVTSTASNGVASFPGLSVRSAGAGARIFASSSTLNGSSSLFDVAAAPLSTLAFTSQPGNQTAGNTIAVSVQAQDSVGNAIAEFGNAVTMSLTGGAAGATLGGTTTVNPVGGVASFSDLTIQKAGNGYQLNASASGVSTVASNAFNVSAGSAVKLGWVAQPQNTYVNAPLNPTGTLPTIAVQDQYGNTVNNNPTIRVQIQTGPGGVSLRDNGVAVTTKDFFPSNGLITFPTNFTVDGAATGMVLSAATPFSTLTAANSSAFDVGAFATKSRLSFTQQPTNSGYGVDFSPVVKVAVQDDYGNTVTSATDNIALNLSTNPGSAALSITSLAATAGLATFSPLTLDKGANGYVMTASSGTLASASSNSFNVTSTGNVASSSSLCDMVRINTTIYFVECGSNAGLKKVEVTGGTVTTLVASGIVNPSRLVTDGTNLYWSESAGAIKRIPIGGGSVTTMVSGLTNLRTGAGTFATDGTNVYFLANNSAGTSAAIRSMAISSSGLNATQPTDLVSASPTSTGYALYFLLDAGKIYFYDAPNDVIKRMASSGGATTTLSTAIGGSRQQFVMIGTTLVFGNNTTMNTIPNAATASSAATPGTPTTGSNWQVWFTDGSNLYANDNGSLRKYSAADFSSTTLAITLVNSPTSLIVDGTSVYGFATNGAIQKQAK